MIIYLRHSNLNTNQSFVTWHSLWADDASAFAKTQQDRYDADHAKDATKAPRMKVEEISERDYQRGKGYKKTVKPS